MTINSPFQHQFSVEELVVLLHNVHASYANSVPVKIAAFMSAIFTGIHMHIFLNCKPRFYIIAEGHAVIFIRLTVQHYGGTAYLCYVSQIERKQDMNPTSVG